MIVRVSTRPAPWLISLFVHVAFAALLMLWPEHPVRKTPSAYDQLIKGKEAQIVFYKFKDKLPDVKPVQRADARPPKATIRIPKQQIVSSPKNAPKGLQTVWQPVPDIISKEVPSPNILAVKVPEMPKPERKKFVPPSDAPKVARNVPQPQLADAPTQLALNTQKSVLDNLGAPALRTRNLPRFTVPPAQSRAVAQTPQMASAAHLWLPRPRCRPRKLRCRARSRTCGAVP